VPNVSTLDIVRAFQKLSRNTPTCCIQARKRRVAGGCLNVTEYIHLPLRRPCRGTLRSYSNLVNLTRGSVVALSEGGISQSVLGASTFNSK